MPQVGVSPEKQKNKKPSHLVGADKNRSRSYCINYVWSYAAGVMKLDFQLKPNCLFKACVAELLAVPKCGLRFLVDCLAEAVA